MRLLDLFCGAGGAGAGYAAAGFDVVGVDLEPQSNYPFEFHQADALTYDLTGFDAIHASPPCQAYAPVTRWRGNAADHPELIGPTHTRLAATRVPWIIENVRTNAHNPTLMLCGSTFGLPIRRHRYFAAGFPLDVWQPPCQHATTDLAFMHKGERAYADAMGCHWMTNREAREAIPPAYTEHLGRHLMDQLT